MSARGDRSDDNIGESAAAVAGHFDHFICRDYKGLRGRNAGEVPHLLKSGLTKEGVTSDRIEIIPDFVEAVERALTLAKPGDLLVILAITSYEQAMNLVADYQRAV
jgi:cyanophycin synthetase